MNRIGVEEQEAVLRVLRNGTLSGFFRSMRGGPEIQAFEASLEAALTTPSTGGASPHTTRVLTCSNGTSALHLALMAFNVEKGDRVAVPALTFSATATAVLMMGGIPVPIDVDPKTWCMNPQDLLNAAKEAPLKAVLPVHLLGVPADMTLIYNAVLGNVPIIEDNAQALLAKYNGQYTGTIGNAATLSFQDTKVMTTLGEGGAVITNNQPDEYQKILSLRNHGQQYLDEAGEFASYTCWNYRLTEAQAAFGVEQLKKLPTWNEYQRYNRLILKDLVDDAEIPLTFQEESRGSRATFYIYGTTCEDLDYRSRALKLFTQKGWCDPNPGEVIGAGYVRTIFDLPLLKPYKTRPLPFSEALVKKFLWFDVGRWQTPDEFLETANDITHLLKEAKK